MTATVITVREKRRPWWVWITPFVSVFIVLTLRNAFIFSTKLYEQGDTGANSILIQQALRFQLLVGHYSREHFSNPGPAYLYAQAAGQWLSRDVLHVVPTDWNGQLLAVYVLDSAFAALIVGVVYGWTRSVRGAAAAFCVVLGCAAAQPGIITGNWMPNLLIITFWVFLLSAASVAARASRDLWVMALAGWMSIHGYAPMLFFVPLITVCALAAALWPDRRRPGRAIARFLRTRRGAWFPAVLISAVLLLPIIIELILHWPGNFAKYLTYSQSNATAGHTSAQIGHYVLWFWWQGANAWLAPVILLAAAIAVTAGLTRGPLARWSAALIALAVVTSLAFGYYVIDAVDLLWAQYIGYFYWAVPFSLVLVIVVGLVEAPTVNATAARVMTAVALTAAIGGVVAFGFLADLRTDVHDNNPEIPAAVATLAARAHGKPLVLTVTGLAWVEAPGFLVQAERTGVRACVNEPAMAYLVTSQFICTAAEIADGAPYQFLDSSAPPGSAVILRFGTPMFGYATVIAGLCRVS